MTLFAIPDIAALIVAFPPQLPTREQQSVVRSLSGNHLINSRTIFTKFRTILQTEPKRIKWSDLPTRLGIERIDWLFECYDGPIRYSKDKQTIVSDVEFREALEDLKARCQARFIELSSFSVEKDLVFEFCDDLKTYHELRLFHSDPKSTTVYLGSPSLVENTKQQIQQAIVGITSDKIDLSLQLPVIPKVVLRDLVLEVAKDIEGIDGEMQHDLDRIIFIPSLYSATQEEKRRAIYELDVLNALKTLEINGFCQLNNEIDTVDVCSRFLGEPSDIEVLTIKGDSTTEIVVLRPVLDQCIEQLKTDAIRTPSGPSARVDQYVGSETEASLIASSSNSALASLLLHSDHRRAIEDALRLAIAEHHLQQRKRFDELFQFTIMAALQLYTTGVGTVGDATLKQRLDEHICEHFRREVVPGFLKTSRMQSGLEHDKARMRETERLDHFCSQSKTLADIQTATFKFARKQKVEHPSPEQLKQVKRRNLQQEAKSMQKMARGSDVLQNLVWILLAQWNESLFMSAGRDTGRMIKQYQLTGDEETAVRLGQWRDKLKAGHESSEDLQGMREMATAAVQRMYGNQLPSNG